MSNAVVPVRGETAIAGLTGLLASLSARSGHELGRQADDVARYALWRAPSTRDELVAVLRWADWVREWNFEHPDRPEQAADRGIDLVATYSDGRRTAVQVVADEAHHLAGRPSPAFATVLDGSRIRAARRLFTTATPLLVAPHLRAANPDVWASMDDPATFGPVAHRLPFGAAISSGPLSDYRLLVLGADEQAAAAVDERVLVDAGIVTDARTLAAALTVLRLARDHGRRRIVTFRSRTAWARTFAGLLQIHHKWAPPELHVDLAAETVTGDQPSDVRATALARLARAGQPGQPQVRVVTNARCLTAGVDVPALDAVVFVDPRRSRADVVQAVGRVLRRAGSKDLGRRRRADPHRCSPESGPVQPLHRRGRRGRHLTRVLIDRGAHPC